MRILGPADSQPLFRLSNELPMSFARTSSQSTVLPPRHPAMSSTVSAYPWTPRSLDREHVHSIEEATRCFCGE